MSTRPRFHLAMPVHDLAAARQFYGDAHMDLFTRNPVAREDCAVYGYAKKVRTAWSLAVAAALIESNETCIGRGPAPVGISTLAAG